MTAEQLHDALNFLPGDLLTATDRLRSATRSRVIPWKRLVPVAACLVILLSAAMVFYQLPVMGGVTEQDSKAEAPAAMAPAQMESAADTAAPQDAPAANAEVPAEEENVNDSHRHQFAEEFKSETGAVSSGCGNTRAAISLEGQMYTIAGSDAIALTSMLINLNYDPRGVCRCTAEFTVDTEVLTGIEVSLSNAFARCEQGQASLTEEQVTLLQTIIQNLDQ